MFPARSSFLLQTATSVSSYSPSSHKAGGHSGVSSSSSEDSSPVGLGPTLRTPVLLD